MITVAILINGQPIYSRSAVNTARTVRGKTIYVLDDGSELAHDRTKRAIPLAIAMLKTIKEPTK